MNLPTHSHARDTAPYAAGSRTADEQGSGWAGTPPSVSQPDTEAHSGAVGYVRLPLELTIYPHSQKHLNTNGLSFYETPDGLVAAGRSGVLPAAKHLTDAELAAEYWSLISHFNKVQWAELATSDEVAESIWANLANRNAIMYRFATIPHYFEVDQ